MADIITTAEGGLEEGERRAERDLGAVIQRVEQLVADVAEHTTTIEGMRENREWISQRLEAIERDLAAIPRVPEDLATSTSSSIANLTERLERIEGAMTDEDEDETKPPHHEHRRDEAGDEREHENGNGKRPSLLDRLF